MSTSVPSGHPSGAVRRHNLATVLQRVHLAPVTRSELTRASGLNRSTIGDLVADLAARRLVVEDEASAAGQIGRPSPVVRPSDLPVAAAITPEVDAVTVALVLLGGRVLQTERIPFAARPGVEDAVDAAVAACGRMLRAQPDRSLVGAGLAIPGIVNRADGVVRLAPHLGWRDVPIARLVAERLGVPTAAANDAALGARAEWVFGAGRGVDDLVYLNGGASGIGGGIIAGGVPIDGATGHAGEFGHAVLRSDGGADTIGVTGTFESAVSQETLLALLGLDDPDQLEARLVAADDPAVAAEVRRQVDVLATAVANAVTVLNPSRVVLGGFLSAIAAASGELLPRLVAERALPGIGERVEIRRSALGPLRLSIGAAGLAFAPLLTDPGQYRL